MIGSHQTGILGDTFFALLKGRSLGDATGASFSRVRAFSSRPSGSFRKMNKSWPHGRGATSMPWEKVVPTTSRRGALPRDARSLRGDVPSQSGEDSVIG